MNKRKKIKKYNKVIDETIKLPDKQGNGVLSYMLNLNERGKVEKYSFAYINFHVSTADNGRVLGFDNCHGRHHRHYKGKEQNIVFTTYENIAEQFEKEWRIEHEKIKHHES